MEVIISLVAMLIPVVTLAGIAGVIDLVICSGRWIVTRSVVQKKRQK